MPHASLEDALQLALDQFRGVTDKGGQPYILHLLRVMLKQPSDAGRQAGVLHDLVEDTSVTIEDLRARGFAPEVIAAVDAMTHRADQSYAEYVIRLSSNETARRIKLADLDDNYRLDRVAYRADSESEDRLRIATYILTHQFLNSEIGEAEYRQRMSPLEKN